MDNRKSNITTKISVILRKLRKPREWSENQLETEVKKALEAYGWCVLKFFSTANTGWPDRVCLSATGKTIWIEFKKPGGVMAALQKVNREWLISHDHYFFQLDTVEACLSFITDTLPNL
jgi:hypothetical protein